MREPRQPLTRMGLRQSLDHPTSAFRERDGGLRVRDHIPALLLPHPLCDRVVLRDLLPVEPALPFAQMNLPEVLVHARNKTDPCRQRLGGPRGTAPGRNINGAHSLLTPPPPALLRPDPCPTGRHRTPLP